MKRTLALTVMLGVGFTACTSPEATRVRADGPGADVGNHKAVVAMHEGSDPFWKTPRVAGIKGPALDPARQADHLSRR
jgi:hypothetical protein